MEIISIIKDLALAGAAMSTAWVAYRGINKWILELRGRTSFKVARGLMLATYKLQDAITSCRSRLIQGREFPDDYPLLGRKATPQQELDGWTYVVNNRWAPVFEALQDYDARVLEAEALWGSEIRNSTKKLRASITKLHLAIDDFLADKYSLGEKFRAEREFGKEIRSIMFASPGAEDNLLSKSITEAIDEIEKKVRPHIGTE